MHPRDSSILTCPVLYLQAGALLWDISCYLKALRKPQVTQTVLEDEYMCRIIAPLWHMKQHFVKACDRGRTEMLRKEGKKWLLIDPMSQHMLAHLHGFSPRGGLCIVTLLLDPQTEGTGNTIVSDTDRWVFLPWALSTGSQWLPCCHSCMKHEAAWGTLVCTQDPSCSVCLPHTGYSTRKKTTAQVFCCRFVISDHPCSWKLFLCRKSNK